MYSINTRLLFILSFILFSITAGAQTSSSIPENIKQRMIKEILKEKLHKENIQEQEDERDISGMLRTTANGIDKKITTLIASSTSEGETSIAVDPADSNNLVLSFMQQGSGLIFPIYFSNNGGSSWAKSTFDARAIASADFPGKLVVGGGDPAFAWDKVSGTVYFAWIYLTSNSTFDTANFTLNWAYSEDKGKTWKVRKGDAHYIGEGMINPSSGVDYGFKDGVCDREWFAIDNSGGASQGTLYCSFINFNAGGQSVKVKSATDTAFGPLHLAYNGSSQFGNVEVDKTGIVHMTVADLGTNQLFHVSSSNGGVSFSPPHHIADGSNYWGQTGIVHNRENGAPNLTVDETGNLYIVWSDFDGTATSYYSRSTNKGVSWSTPIRIDTLSPLTTGMQTLMPTVAASGKNVAISVTVIDGSDSARYLQYTSTDNGATFSKTPQALSSAATYYPQYLSNTSIFFGDYNRSVASNCNTYAIWEDGRKTQGPKVYTATTNHCTTGIQEITAVTSPIQLVSVYPNPANSEVTLSMSATKNETMEVVIYDMLGKQVDHHTLNVHTGKQEIHMPLDLNTGMYVVSLTNKDGLIATRNLQIIK